MSRPAPLTAAEKARRYRARRRQNGVMDVLFKLPEQAVALIDEYKQRKGLSNRDEALLQLIEEGRAIAQHMP